MISSNGHLPYLHPFSIVKKHSFLEAHQSWGLPSSSAQWLEIPWLRIFPTKLSFGAGIFQQATFDYRRVFEMCHRISRKWWLVCRRKSFRFCKLESFLPKKIGNMMQPRDRAFNGGCDMHLYKEMLRSYQSWFMAPLTKVYWKIYLHIGSMYAIYGNIYHQYTPNVSIYTIHGSYGL